MQFDKASPSIPLQRGNGGWAGLLLPRLLILDCPGGFDAAVGAVMGFFFPLDQQRFPKKGIFPVLLRAVLPGRHDKSEGATRLPELAPGKLGCVLCSATLPSTSGPHCLNLANEGFFCGFV